MSSLEAITAKYKVKGCPVDFGSIVVDLISDGTTALDTIEWKTFTAWSTTLETGESK